MRLGYYLSPEPLLQSPLWLKDELRAGRQVAVYSYAANNPITNYDSDGNTTRQYRRDGKGNEWVRALEAPLRAELVQQCKKEAEENEAECVKKSTECNPPALPPNASISDLRQRDEQILAGIANCIKGANCEYEACLAGATSASGTADYQKAWAACMRRR